MLMKSKLPPTMPFNSNHWTWLPHVGTWWETNLAQLGSITMHVPPLFARPWCKLEVYPSIASTHQQLASLHKSSPTFLVLFLFYLHS
jgi:hypothetical protein